MIILNLNNKKTYEIIISKSGENHMVCPECSAERSKNKKAKCFSWNTAKESGYCHHCNSKFVVYNPVGLKDEKTYIKPTWKNKTDLSDLAVKYFESRKISQETVKAFKIYSDIEWMPQTNANIEVICFPYFYNESLYNVKFRGKNKAFKLSKDAELIFYNLDCLKNNNEIIIVEGEFDALAFYEAGFKNVISVPNGANANLVYLNNYIDLFDNKKIIIATDNDIKGFELRNELIRRFGAEVCSTVDFEDCKDANEYLMEYGKTELAILIERRTDVPISGVVDLKDKYDDIYNMFVNGMPEGAKINDELDNIVTWETGRLAIWTGIPSHGKSEVVDWLNVNLNITNKWKIAYYSPENFPVQYHFSKLFSKLCGKSFDAKYVCRDEFKHTFDYINDNFFIIMPDEQPTMDKILEKAKFLIRKQGIKVLVIDPYNKIEHNQGSMSETAYISVLLDKLVNFARVNDILIHLVAHPTKMKKDVTGLKYDVPTLYDIAGSANFYNKADYGISIYRDFNFNTTDINIQKVKFKNLGQGGKVQKQYNSINGRYEHLSLNSNNFTYESMLSFKLDAEDIEYIEMMQEKLPEKQTQLPIIHEENKIFNIMHNQEEKDFF